MEMRIISLIFLGLFILGFMKAIFDDDVSNSEALTAFLLTIGLVVPFIYIFQN